MSYTEEICRITQSWFRYVMRKGFAAHFPLFWIFFLLKSSTHPKQVWVLATPYNPLKSPPEKTKTREYMQYTQDKDYSVG